MNRLPRFKPEPMPAIFPLPEYAATGARKAVYEETKAALGVPWMGVVTMAFSHYASFYAALWSGVGPLCRSEAFRAACHELRAFTETQTAGCACTALRPVLSGKGYADRELDAIRATVEIFAAGNMPYVLIATLARLLLAGVMPSPPAATSAAAMSRAEPAGTVIATGAPLVLTERHHADAATVAVYDDIQATLGLPFVNTDYRALARWPSYFQSAWADLKPYINAAGYERVVTSVHDKAVCLVRSLPGAEALQPAALQAAALADAPAGEVEATVQLFQWLLPGLAVNVACLQQQLDTGLASRRRAPGGMTVAPFRTCESPPRRPEPRTRSLSSLRQRTHRAPGPTRRRRSRQRCRRRPVPWQPAGSRPRRRVPAPRRR